MYRANVDTPWITVAEGGEAVNTAKLPVDPAFSADIKGWRDVTGSEGVEVEPGRTLYGGNYALVTQILPDYSVGRLGGSGDPDFLTIEVQVESEAILQAIDAETDYWVYWDEVVEDQPGPATAAAAWRPKDTEPPANEWGMLRSKLATRGYTQAWVDKYLGTNRNRVRGEHDANIRNGYITGQLPAVQGAVTVSTGLTPYLVDQGWRAVFDGLVLIVTINIPGPDAKVIISYSELVSCNYSNFEWPNPLKQDICDWMKANNFCEVCV